MWLNTSRRLIQKVGPEGLNIKGTLLKPYTPHKLNTTTKTKGQEDLHRISVNAQLVVLCFRTQELGPLKLTSPVSLQRKVSKKEWRQHVVFSSISKEIERYFCMQEKRKTKVGCITMQDSHGTTFNLHYRNQEKTHQKNTGFPGIKIWSTLHFTNFLRTNQSLAVTHLDFLFPPNFVGESRILKWSLSQLLQQIYL